MCRTLAKSRLSRSSRVFSEPALQHLGDEGAARLEHRRGEVERFLGQRHDPQVVSLAVASRRRRHVGEDEVDRSAERTLELTQHRVVLEVADQRLDTRQRLDRRQVEGDHPATASLAGTYALGRDLRPTARRGPQVDDPRTRLQEAELVVHLDQLKAARER